MMGVFFCGPMFTLLSRQELHEQFHDKEFFQLKFYKDKIQYGA